MKILIIHTQYTQYGGEDSVVAQEAKLLKQKNNVKTLFFKNKRGVSGLIQFLLSLWNIKSSLIVKKEIKQFKPDIIHIHNWHFASGPIIIRTASKMNIPIVFTLHNYRLICPSAILFYKNKLFLDSLNQAFPWSAIFKKVYKNSMLLSFWLAFIIWFHKKIGTWNMIDTYICLTPSAIDLFKDSWMYSLVNKFTVKPNFSEINCGAFIRNIQRESHYLFIGRLTEEKGIRMLINAFKKLPYNLKIVGDGPLKNFVKSNAQTMRNISYEGVLTKEQISIELRKTHALIFTSTWLETFGLVITEAFSNSCIVISTNIGAPGTLVIDMENGLHFEPNSIDSLIKIIKKWEALPESIKEDMRGNALKVYKEKYTPEKQHQFFNVIYKKFL